MERIKKIWLRGSSPISEGAKPRDGEFTIERLNAGYFTSRKNRLKLQRRKEYEKRKQAVMSTLEEIRRELEQLEQIAFRNANSQVVGSGKGENLDSDSRRQWLRLTQRIEERKSELPSFYTYEMQRLRFSAVGLPFVHRLTGLPL